MPKIVFTEEELQRVEQVANLLDPRTLHRTREAMFELGDERSEMKVAEWTRQQVRGALLNGMMARAVAAKAEELGSAERGEALGRLLYQECWKQDFFESPDAVFESDVAGSILSGPHNLAGLMGSVIREAVQLFFPDERKVVRENLELSERVKRMKERVDA